MSLEDIEKQLYVVDGKRKMRKRSPATKNQKSPTVPDDWKDEDEDEEVIDGRVVHRESRQGFHISLPMLFIGIIVLFIVVAVFILAFLFGGSGGQTGVALVITSPGEVSRGVPFEISINIDNQSDGILRDATLSANVPSGIVPFGMNGGSSSFVNEAVGDIGGGSLAKKLFRFLPTGQEQSVQSISFTLTYLTEGRNRYEVSEISDVTIGTPAITIDVEKPSNVLSGSTFELVVRYENVSSFNFPDVVIQANYPSAFRFVSANFPPDSLNNYWRLGELRAGSRGELIVRGVVDGITASKFSVSFAVAANFLGAEYPVTTHTATVSVAPSPVNLQIAVNHKLDYVARIGDSMDYTVHYQNNSGIALADVVITASLAGDLFNMGELSTEGQIDSIANSITWNASNAPFLKLIDVGASGDLRFHINLVDTFPIRRLSDKNFVVRVKAHLDSPSTPFYLQATRTASDASLDTKVGGVVFLDTQAFYRDASSGIANQGPFPPKANIPTEYTVHWIITNYATDIKNVKVTAALEPGVEWTGIVKSNVSSVPLVNSGTREITWIIDTIPATKGVIGAPVEAIFQVRGTPSITDIGGVQRLTKESRLTAIDDFVGLTLESSDIGITTDLPDDKTVGYGNGEVTP